MEIAIVLGLLLVAIILFATEKLSVDIITFIIIIVLVLTKVLTPEEAFAGFSSDFIIILASIFVISGTLTETGVLDKIGAQMVNLVNRRKKLLLANATIVPGILSAFMNNTTVTALFIGPFMGIAKKLKVSPSKLLMPLAYSSILGGTCTLIGTSTNVAVSSALPNYGMETLTLFEITPVGLVLFGVGALYMIIIGNYFIPARQKVGATEDVNSKDYYSEIVVSSESSLVGKAINATKFNGRLRVISIIRDEKNFNPDEDEVIEADDILLIESTSDQLIKIKEMEGVEIRADLLQLENKKYKGNHLAEVLITPKSSLVKKTIKESDFRSLYKVTVSAIHRMDHDLESKLDDVCLQTGDLLLVQGKKEAIKDLRDTPDFIMLDDFKPNLFLERKGFIAVGLFLAAVIAGSTELVPLSIAFMMAGLFIVLLRIITPEKAYRLIDWRLLVLIGGMSAFGVAMKNSGASEFLANWIVKIFEPFGIYAVLAAFVVLVVLLTQPMSNAAAALVVLPIAVATAQKMQVDPRTFAIAIMLGASVSLIAPLEPACILVYGPGKYKFKDFIIIGFPITLILVAIIVFLVPVFFPL
jgi:di/tricarboxylate transporter